VQNGDIKTYLKKPFTLYVNGEEVENVKRFAIDLSNDSLFSKERHGGSTFTEIVDWTYTVEHNIPVSDGLLGVN